VIFLIGSSLTLETVLIQYPRKQGQNVRCSFGRGDMTKRRVMHSWAASMLRVEKHNKAKKDRRRNALQLKDARAELKRARRKRRREKRQAEKLAQAAARPATSAQLKARNDRADLQLLNWVRLRYELETIDPARLEAMIRDGYVVPEPEEPQAHRITGQGLQRIKILRQTVGRGPGTI
jgi:hypothetical protein